MQVGVISCCKTKLPHAAPARELYCSDYFKMCQEWILRCGCVDTYVILSAKLGVVQPSDVVEPYEQPLDDYGTAEYKAWCAGVQASLLEQFGEGASYVVLAGSSYRNALYGLPRVEDVIRHWTLLRRYKGMKKPIMGFGAIKKELRTRLDREPSVRYEHHLSEELQRVVSRWDGRQWVDGQEPWEPYTDH